MKPGQLTVVSVLGPDDGPYWEIAAELLIQHLQESNIVFHLVDNYKTITEATIMQTTIYRQDDLRYGGFTATRGSIEHSRCLNHLLSQLNQDSGLILIIDPDFFIIDGRKLRQLVHEVQTTKTAMLGTTWHKRWATKSQHWIAPHFVLFDSSRIAPNLLDFSTGFRVESGESRGARQFIPQTSTVASVYRATLGRFRSESSPDTGYKVAEQVRAAGGQLRLLSPCSQRRTLSILNRLIPANLTPKEVARSFSKSIQTSEFFQDSGSLWAIHLRKQARLSTAPPASMLRSILKFLDCN